MLMESWSYVSQEKGFLSDETISPPGALARSKSAFGNGMLLPTQQNIENQGFRELSFPEMVGKQLPMNHPTSDAWSNKLGDAHGGRVIDSVMAAPNGFPNGKDSNSKRSISVVESNGRDSFIDLKLGRFGDQRDSKDVKFSEVAPVSVLSSSSSSTPPKRARASGGHSQTAFCQVYGCNKDLSGSKEYHKRHKVCELHSKTAKVIVNGIEQRFCQQCSRFHLLAEFDDGKRSCRKRLAGHNERRRKPQVVVHGRPGRLLQSYTDNRFQGTSLATASFICQDILPSRLLHGEKLAADDWFRPVKTEDGGSYSNLSAVPVSNGQPNFRCFVPSFNSEKPFSFLQENDASTAAGNIFAASNCQYPASLGVPNSGPRSLFHGTSLECEDFNVFDAASNVQGLSGFLDSGRALSLLSSQSQNSSAHSAAGVLMPSSFVMQSSQSHYSISQVSEKVTGMSSQNSSNGVLNKFPSTEMIPGDGHLGVVLISDCSDVVNFNVSDEILQETDFSNAKDHLTCRDGPTVDLLQLSSQLQRVEHHRQTAHVKPENLQHKYQLNGS